MADFNLNAKRTLEVIEKQVNTANYRARNVGLADAFTVDQWLTILNYWGWRCAICNLSSTDLSPDHWLPLSHEACPGSTYDNIIPMCEGCNLSKNRTEPIAWLAKRFDAEMVTEKVDKVRKAFQELAAVGHSFNTTIPERAYLAEPTKQVERYRKLTLVFDMTIPIEKQVYDYYSHDIQLPPDQMQRYLKNLLWFLSRFVTDLIYADPKWS